jgi:hypothetical protein
VIVTIVILEFDNLATSKFVKGLESAHWIVSDGNAKLWREAEIEHDIAHTFNVATSTASGPPPAAPSTCNPTIPTLAALNAAMIRSEDRLFFISIPFSSNDVREWRLVQLE